jgi:hypothetical protein
MNFGRLAVGEAAEKFSSGVGAQYFATTGPPQSKR